MSDIIDGGQIPGVTVTAPYLNKKSSLGDMAATPELSNEDLVKKSQYDHAYAGGIRFGASIYPFYYDQQLNNQITSVTLHVNTTTDDGGINWKEASGDVDEEGYLKFPIARAILNEDYQVAVSNNFSEFGNDLFGNMFNQFKPYAPYAAKLTEMLGDMNTAEKEMEIGTEDEQSAINSTIGRALDKFTDITYKAVEELPSLLNRTLIAQGARFSYYSGTGVGFGNLSMKFTVFSDWINGEWVNVNKQLEPLYPYCFGKYVEAIDEKGNVTGTKNVGGGFISKEKDIVNRYFGWQLPPGGNKAELNNIDKSQFGTLKLKFGTFYSLPNLVVESIQFNFSKQMVKVWIDGQNDICPLYCDVVITLKPASKFTDVALRKFVSGQSMENERSVIETALNDVLNKKKNENSNFLNGE